MESELRGPAGEGVTLTQEARRLGLAGGTEGRKGCPLGVSGCGWASGRANLSHLLTPGPVLTLVLRQVWWRAQEGREGQSAMFSFAADLNAMGGRDNG